jgi:hypothetical protein
MQVRVGVVVAAVIALIAMAAPAQAASWDYAAWGWQEPAGPAVDFQWGKPFAPVKVNDRWTLRDCDGDAPFVCFASTAGGEGKAELILFDLRQQERLQRDLTEHGRDKALRRWAYDHYRHFRADRTDCRKGYTFHPFRPRPATVAGRDGIRMGFAVKDAGGRVVERSVTFGTVTKTKLVVIGTEGLNRRSCIAILGETFTPSALRRMGPYVAQAAASGRLPSR